MELNIINVYALDSHHKVHHQGHALSSKFIYGDWVERTHLRQAAGVVAPGSSAGGASCEARVALAAEFPRYDSSLIDMLLSDQGDDATEVRFYLRVRATARTIQD